MDSLLTPAAKSYYIDWIVTFGIAGAGFLFLGLAGGWIIWRKSRKLAESVEEKTRTAVADCERTRDEISRIKSELAAA